MMTRLQDLQPGSATALLRLDMFPSFSDDGVTGELESLLGVIKGIPVFQKEKINLKITQQNCLLTILSWLNSRVNDDY